MPHLISLWTSLSASGRSFPICCVGPFPHLHLHQLRMRLRRLSWLPPLLWLLLGWTVPPPHSDHSVLGIFHLHLSVELHPGLLLQKLAERWPAGCVNRPHCLPSDFRLGIAGDWVEQERAQEASGCLFPPNFLPAGCVSPNGSLFQSLAGSPLPWPPLSSDLVGNSIPSDPQAVGHVQLG